MLNFISELQSVTKNLTGMVSLYTGGQAVIMLADWCPMHWIKLTLRFSLKETKMCLRAASYQAENYI